MRLNVSWLDMPSRSKSISDKMCRLLIKMRFSIFIGPGFVVFELTYRSSGGVRVVWGGGVDDGHVPDDVSRFLGLGGTLHHRRTGLADHRVETVYRVSGIVDGSHGAVGLHETVLATHHVSGPLFRLVFDVACGRIVHAVLVSVASRHLDKVHRKLVRGQEPKITSSGTVSVFMRGIAIQGVGRNCVSNT